MHRRGRRSQSRRTRRSARSSRQVAAGGPVELGYRQRRSVPLLDEHRDAGPPPLPGCRASGRPVSRPQWPRPRRARRPSTATTPNPPRLRPWPSARRTSGAGRSSRRTAGSGPPRRGFRTGRPGRRRRSAPPAGRRGTGLRAAEPAAGRCRRSHVEVCSRPHRGRGAATRPGAEVPSVRRGRQRLEGRHAVRRGGVAVHPRSCHRSPPRTLTVPASTAAHGRHQSPRSARTLPRGPTLRVVSPGDRAGGPPGGRRTPRPPCAGACPASSAGWTRSS